MKEHKLEQLFIEGGCSASVITATCEHRCKCACHSEPGNKHMMACCTGCDEGHVQVDYGQMSEHLRICHLKL